MVSYQEHTSNTQLIDWIKEMEELCQPEQVYLCDVREENTTDFVRNWSIKELLSN